MIRKTAIITGGFGDIGKETAKKFASNGYNVALTFFNTFDADFIEELKTFGVDVMALHCDQRLESDVINFVNSVFNEFEFVDVCVCNAGKAENSCFLFEKPTELIDDIISTNLKGTILFNREISRRFLKQKHGCIVNVSSIYGETGASQESVYSACKAGVNNLTKSLSVELAPNIRVNAVAPGLIDTKMNSELSDEILAFAVKQTPLKRAGLPSDVANAIFFLASDESSFITGEILTVSGGAKWL